MSESRTPDSLPRAFVIAPDATRYFPSAVAEEARQRISRSIVRGEGPALLIGAAGTGKSLLLEVLAQQFRDQREIVPLSGGQICTRRALLQTILFNLQLPYQGLDEGELRLALVAHIQPNDQPSRRLLILVDEADNLAVRLLEELRLLSNLSAGGETLVNLVLTGGPSLEERFADPQLMGFSQRLSTRCYLSALGREETFQYVRAQVAAAGRDPEALFSHDGLEAIFAATDGVPRLVNQLGDQLVWMNHSNPATPLSRQEVQHAWSDLQQLPAPWNTPPATAEISESVVEFGELSMEIGADLDACSGEPPALIPMKPTHCDDSESVETVDATEDLFDQLERLDHASLPVEVELVESIPAAQNPFEEVFPAEEVVLDQYSVFESDLLANAPRVINRLDTAFASQLRECLVDHPSENLVQGSVVAALSSADEDCLDEEDTQLDAEDDVDVLLAADSRPAADPGELLIVEDEGRPQVKVVPGRQFRQLFSCLDTQQSPELSG